MTRAYPLWDVLAVFFFLCALGLAWAAYLESGRSLVVSALPLSASSEGDGRPMSLPAQQWLPYDVYEPVFKGRDIFKTQEERALEATVQPVVPDPVGALSWGEGYQLTGVMVDSDPRAVVKVFDPPGLQVLSLGDRLGDAVLTRVEEKAAYFEFKGHEFKLEFAKSGP